MAKNKHSAVRKLDPETLQEIPQELQEIVGQGTQVEVGQSDGTTSTETAKPADTNKIAISYNLTDLMKEHKTKSGVIRFLASKDFKTAEIAKFIDVRYQHVRNVLTTPAKKAPAAPAAQTETK